MSLVSGKYWTGDPKIKPDAWGPFEDVQAAIMENADNIYGIDYQNITAYLPLWWNIKDYGRNSLTCTKSNLKYYKNSALFQTDSYISIPNSVITGSEFTIIFDEFSPSTASSKSGYFLCDAGDVSNLFLRRNAVVYTKYDGAIADVVLSAEDLLTFNVNKYHTSIVSVKNNVGKWDINYLGNGYTYNSVTFSGLVGSLFIGNRLTLDRDFNGYISFILVLNKAITDEQKNLFFDYKYGLLQPIIRRSYFIPSGDITIKTIYDSGFCSDTISGLSNQLSVLDMGSGIDGFYGMSADLSISDAGYGIDIIKPVASISVNDTASAIDAISQILNYCSVVDSGAANDSLANILASITVADTGAGADIINVLKELLKTVTDSCSCVDNVSQISVSSSVSDSASGIDILSQILADISVTDTGSGADFLSLIKDILKTISDVGTCVDYVSIQPVAISVQDVGLALDLIGNIAAALTITDSATAAEIISTIKTKLVTVSDSAIGSDNQSISVSLTVADTITAIDTIKQIINALSISDAGFAIESIAKIDLDNTPTGHVRITITLKAPGIRITSRTPGINISTQ